MSLEKEYKQRCIEILAFEDKWMKIKNIDAYVDYDLAIATDCYKNGVYPSTLLFCAIAIEEQLSAIYDVITKNDASRLM